MKQGLRFLSKVKMSYDSHYKRAPPQGIIEDLDAAAREYGVPCLPGRDCFWAGLHDEQFTRQTVLGSFNIHWLGMLGEVGIMLLN